MPEIGVNKVILIGRTGADSELSQYQPGFPFWKRSGNLQLTSNVNIDTGCSINRSVRRRKPNG